MNRLTVHYDPQSDVLYFEEGQLLGVEILNASRFLRAAIGPERLAQLARAEA